MKKTFIMFIVLALVFNSSASECSGFNQNDLIQTGIVEFKNTKGAIREHCLDVDIKYPVPDSGYEVSVSTSFVGIRTPRSGIDYSVRAGKKNDRQKLNIVLLINDDVTWTSIQVSYIVTSRKDFRVGSFIADTFSLLDCSPINRNDQFEASTQVANWVPTAEKLKVLAFISGVRTQDFSFTTRIQKAQINNRTGILSVQIYSDAYPNLESIHINYIIYEENSPFRFGEFKPEDSDYYFSGVDQLLAATNVETRQSILSFLNTKINCQGTKCPSSCMDQSRCKALEGILNGRVCHICQYGEIFQQGRCKPRCSEYQTFVAEKCICINGYTRIGFTCVKIAQCKTDEYVDLETNTCFCRSGFVKINGVCQRVPKCNQDEVLNSQNNVCVCKQGFRKIGNDCVKIKICQSFEQYNFTTNECFCISGYSRPYNGNCVKVPACGVNQQLDTKNNICVCKEGFQRINGDCLRPNPICQFNQIIENYICVCKSGYIRLGLICVQRCGINQILVNDNCICKENSIKISGVCRQCPLNTIPAPNGQSCQCKPGFIINSGQCVPDIKCPQYSQFVNGKCQCNVGYVFNNGKCEYISNTPSCPVNSVWNKQKLQCQCIRTNQYLINGGCQPCGENEGWNGSKCVCRTGFFSIQGKCRTCALNTFYNGRDCVCNPGFFGNRDGCRNCHYTCSGCTGAGENQCTACVDVSYTLNKTGFCVRDSPCPKGFYLVGKACKACSQYCDDCDSANTCKSCINGFKPQQINVGGSQITFCVEVCGDGKRFEDQCDDGNNYDGDGCSSKCKTDQGWTCTGGSSIRRDSCAQLVPERNIIQPRSAVLLFGRVVHGIRLSNIPEKLQENNCAECSKLLWVKVISSTIVPGVRVEYIPKSKFQYLAEFDFHGTISIPVFKFTVQINPKYASFFSKEDLQQVEIINIDPALLARVDQTPTLSFESLGSSDIEISEEGKALAFRK